MTRRPILDIDRLRVEFGTGAGRVVAVDEVSLSVAPGEIHAMVGESGAGKSSVGNAVMGLLEAPGRIASGTISIAGEPFLAGNPSSRIVPGRDIGAIFQDPMTSLNPLYTVGSQLTEGLRHHLGLEKEAARERAIRLLREVEIDDPVRRFSAFPHELSGGQRQRVMIATALSCEPKLIVADEPTTALDVSVEAQILAMIRRLADRHGIGVLLITHNMDVVRRIADTLSVMYKGRAVESGAALKVLRSPRHEYARALINSVPDINASLSRLPVLGEEQERARKARNSLAAEWKSGSRGAARPAAQGPLLEIRSLSVDYAKKGWLGRGSVFRALDGIDLFVKEGEILGIVGESGCGKTTLARAIAGLTPVTSGEVLFRGREIGADSRAGSQRQIQVVFQDPYSSLNSRMKVLAAVAEPIRFHFAPGRDEAAMRAGRLLEAVGIAPDAAPRYPYAFSGGQRQRISIARALASMPSLLICDEPTSALDVSIQARILNLLKDLRDATGLSMLFISHDLPVIRHMCDRVAVMQRGRIVEINDSATIFSKPRHPYTRHLIDSITHGSGNLDRKPAATSFVAANQ